MCKAVCKHYNFRHEEILMKNSYVFDTEGPECAHVLHCLHMHLHTRVPLCEAWAQVMLLGSGKDGQDCQRLLCSLEAGTERENQSLAEPCLPEPPRLDSRRPAWPQDLAFTMQAQKSLTPNAGLGSYVSSMCLLLFLRLYPRKPGARFLIYSGVGTEPQASFLLSTSSLNKHFPSGAHAWSLLRISC